MFKYIFLLLMICAVPAFSQQHQLEIGARMDAARTPNKQVYGSYVYTNAFPGGLSSYTTFSFWRVGQNQVNHSAVTGIEKPIFKGNVFTFASHIQAGEAQAVNAFSGALNTGFSIALFPKKFKGSILTITGGATDIPATGAWYPNVAVGIRRDLTPAQ